MRTRARGILGLLLLAAPTASLGLRRPEQNAADGAGQKRIRFQIQMVEQDGGTRKPVSSAIVEGPPGLDFNVTLHAGLYDMDARFLTDLIGNNMLQVRARLETHRLYGYSGNRLPLYEEDTRSQALELGFDEQMILFPFGQSGGDNLRIEISPALTANEVYQTPGRLVPPEITFLQNVEGVIHIEAIKVPHRFEVEAALVEDGREIARGAGEFLLQQKQELPLLAVDPAGPEEAAAIALSVDRYTHGCPEGSAAFSFDVYGPGGRDLTSREPVAAGWAGIQELDSDSIYGLAGTGLAAAGKKRELRLRVMPANGETGY